MVMPTPQSAPAKAIAIEEFKTFIGSERDGRQVKKSPIQIRSASASEHTNYSE